MSTLLHADIFFFITAIAVVVLATVLTVALVYLIRVLKDAGYVADRVKRASDDLAKDLEDFRKSAREEGAKVKALLSMVKVKKEKSDKKKVAGHK